MKRDLVEKSGSEHSGGEQASPDTVVRCYSVFDKFFPTCGLLDYTEGMYYGDPNTPYDVAQQNQINYVLDQVGVARGVRVLEIGCGNGTLLDEVRRRGAQGIGVTISPEQVALCTRRGLDVRLLNYRDLGEDFFGRFDTVIANGPIEHFVQAEDAANGRDDAIYTRFFEICHRAIDPASTNRKFINTTINFVRPPEPGDLLKSPGSFPRGSDAFHYAWLARAFGGWYPKLGQLEACGQRHFTPRTTLDGTYDYYLTSEEWLRRIQAEMFSLRGGLKFLNGSLKLLARHPKQLATMLNCMLVTQSWNWQFRAPNPPTRLLRTTWDYVA